MPHFSFKRWRAVCLTKILAPFIAGYYSWITHSTIDFNRSILDVYLFLHDKNRTHYISMIVSKIKKYWVRQKSNNYMYFKVYGIFISLLSLYFTKKIHGYTQLGQECFFLFIFYKFINSPFPVFLLRYFHFLKTTHAHYFFVLRMINYYCTLVNFNTF